MLKDDQGQNLLHLAVRGGFQNKYNFLLENIKLNPNEKDNKC